MPKFLLGLFAALLISNAAHADTSNLVRKQSPYSAEETLNRLEAIVLSKGATVFARIDHAAGAMKADTKLRPTAVLIFGNPKIGTPIMLKSQEAGLDLPMKALAYEDANGKVWLTYRQPQSMGAAHGIAVNAPETMKVAKVLDALTNAAIKQ
jgi:uncharacterized protein (DUF302 family)